jgi:hypothetical protein
MHWSQGWSADRTSKGCHTMKGDEIMCRPRAVRSLCAVALLMLLTVGCARFREDHYFQSVSQLNGRPTNFFRLRISGASQLGLTRYVAGYYDERAVDLFFNEVKPSGSDTSPDAGSIKPIFVDNQKNPGTDDKIKPLSPDAQHGAFLLLFSTNAKAVADTIGQFAESQIVADAITNLANQGHIKEANAIQANLAEDVAKNADKVSALESLYAAVAALGDPPPDRPADLLEYETHLENAYVRILNSLASATGNRSKSFASLDEARIWFEALAEKGR